MTRTFSTIAVAAVTLSLTAPLAYLQGTEQAGPKIGYIKSREILSRTPAAAELEKQIQAALLPFQDKLKVMSDSNNTITADYQTKAASMTPEARAAKEKEISDKRRIWQAKSDTITMKADQKRDELQTPFMDKLKEVLNDTRVEKGLWMILDVDSPPAHDDGLIVAFDKNMDLTETVLARFKTALAGMPKAPGAPTPGAGSPVNQGTGVGAGGTKPPPEP